MSKRWYVLQVFSGHEYKVKKTLESRIEDKKIIGVFERILVPTEEIIEIKLGKKRKSERKFFPGYVLIQMDIDKSSWHVIRNIPKVLGFVGGSSGHPTPIDDKEVDSILDKIQESTEKPKPKVLFDAGELIRITDGPFVDFNGTVEEVNYDKSRLRVSVLIFGRSTPVNLNFVQVEKA